MHDLTRLTTLRIDRYIAEWIVPAVVRSRQPLDVESWPVPDEPVPFSEARRAEYQPFEIGTAWGRPWSTVWFHVRGAVPQEWGGSGTRVELAVDLGWIAQQPGFQAEGAAWSPGGRLVKGIAPRNSWVPIDRTAPIDLYIEAAANPDVPGGQWSKPTKMGDKATAGSDEIYRLEAVDVVEIDVEVEALLADARTLRGLFEVLPESSPRRAEIVAALEDMCDAVDPDDVAGSAADGRAALAGVIGRPASQSSHRVAAVGHAHIDSAWLWPVRETMRKVSRTVSNVLALMDEDPDLVFAFSSAQQYQWLEERYPELFERLAERVREGRIMPVGGMWVESDTNMVGGEALVRQFVQGKGYFLSRFGVDPTSVWLPDSFGYTGAFPQVARLAGCTDFLTQKLSWNDTNRMPHHTFWWEGIDGTRVFTHFPPVNTYNSNLSAEELELASAEFREKGRASISLAPFGYGDGGGGPTREMVAQAHRTESLEGSPRVELVSPDQFFDDARAEFAEIAPTWVGEMYLEYHRGTYTTQSRTKRGNRRSEHLLREAELWAATAAVRVGAEYPYEQLERIWQRVLLLQFHDILPGTSIAWVHREAEQVYGEIAAELGDIIAEALAALASRWLSGGEAGVGTVASDSPTQPARGLSEGDAGVGTVASDSLTQPVRGLSEPEASRNQGWRSGHGNESMATAPGSALRSTSGTLVANASPFERDGIAPGGIGVAIQEPHARLTRDGDDWVFENGSLRVRVDARGLVTSAVHLESGREAIAEGTPGNLLQLARDIPNTWEAWDIDEHYRRTITDLTDAESVEETTDDDGAPALRIVRAFSGSRFVQVLSLAPGSDASLRTRIDVDWHEKQKLLKLGFTFDVHADQARSEMQFGHVTRPTHANTSWDAARFETVAHRWVHVGEPGFGVALANDGTYGHDVTRVRTPGDHVASRARWSLLRAPLFPDPVADQGEHTFRFTVTLGADTSCAVAHGYALNLPLRDIRGLSGGEAEVETMASDSPAYPVTLSEGADRPSRGLSGGEAEVETMASDSPAYPGTLREGADRPSRGLSGGEAEVETMASDSPAYPVTPLRSAQDGEQREGIEPLVRVSDPAIVVESVKLAEDRSGDLIVRLYESRGARAEAELVFADPITAVRVTDLLERSEVEGAVGAIAPTEAGARVELRPFQVLTVRATR